jgi:hypothetical protein
MTLPDERYRAVIQTRRFLIDLTNPQHTPRLPKLIRQTAAAMLRHYPNEWEMRRVTEGHGETLFQIEMEPLYRMVKQFEQDTEEGKNK